MHFTLSVRIMIDLTNMSKEKSLDKIKTYIIV